MHATTIAILTSLVALTWYHLCGGPKIRRNGKRLRWPPNTLPLVGNGIIFLQARHKLFSWFVKCERQFGFETFQISVPSLPLGVVINDPKNLEYVLKNEGIFAKGELFKNRSWDLFGNGIINADGELWKTQRKAGLHFLSSSNLRIITDAVLPKYLISLIKELETTPEDTPLDLEAVFHELTTQLMGEMAYSMEMHNTDPFSLSFDYASGKIGERFQNPLWRLTEVFNGQRLKESVTRVKDFGSLIVGNALNARRNKIQAQSTIPSDATTFNEMSGSLISSLLDAIDDHQVVADAALNYLSAGRDTTAQALTWTFYLLMRHPAVVGLIRQEISSLQITVSDAPSSPAKFRPVSLPYITAVFYEALRLYPPVPLEIKQCERATTLPDGTYLPKSTILVWCIWAMNRSELIWAADADNFMPERWLKDGTLISKPAYEFPVFNGGPRTCLGRKMAELVAVQIIATLVERFNFEALDDTERISKNSLTLPMEGGLPCYVKLRTKSI